MRLLRSQRQEPINVTPEEVFEGLAQDAVQQFEAGETRPIEEFAATFDVALINSNGELTTYEGLTPTGTPTALFSVGDRFQSVVTGLKLELIEPMELHESKGWKWSVKILAAGENTHHKRGELTVTFESTLAADFEQLSRDEKIEEKKTRARKEKEEQPPSPPKIALPETFSDGMPWASWPLPNVSSGKLTDFFVREYKEELALVNNETGEFLGDVTDTAREELGKRVGFPPDFVAKLSPTIAASVMNERIQQDKGEHEFQIVFEGDKWSNLVPAWRGILPTKIVAELAYRQLRGWYPDIEIDTAERGEGWARLRFLTPVAYPVTNQAGDVLRLGLDISHQYGDTLKVALYTRRLASGGGMLSNGSEFSWRSRTDGAGSADSQAVWLEEEITRTVCAFTEFIEKCKRTSEHYIAGDLNTSAAAFLNELNLPKRFAGKLIEACILEGNDTYWAMCNAASRMALELGDDSRSVMQAIGEYITAYE